MSSALQPPTRAADLVDTAIATVRRWVEAAPPEQESRLRKARAGWDIADVVRDHEGREFATQFVDLVIRPQDERTAARNLERLSRELPSSLPGALRVLIQLAGGFALLTPRAVLPAVRSAFRRSMHDYVLDGGEKRLEGRLEQLREGGIRVSLAPFGDSVLGGAEADRRLARATELLARPDVDAISLTLTDLVAPLHPWAHDETVERAVDRLEPLYRAAAAAPTPKLITLDMGDSQHLDLTVDVFTALLSRPGLTRYEGAITLQAYLPRTQQVLLGLTAWAQERRHRGGAGITVRLVKGGHIAGEGEIAELGGRTPAILSTRLETDTNLKRLLDVALTPENTAAVRVTVGSNNLFDIAFAHALAAARGVGARLAAEMHLGAAPHAESVREELGAVTLYAPAVPADSFSGAAGYLIERLREQGDPGCFRSAVGTMATDGELFEREAERFRASVAALDALDDRADSAESQQRHPDVPPMVDPSTKDGRQWARAVLARARDADRDSHRGAGLLARSFVRDAAALDERVAATAAAGETWGAESAQVRRAALLDFAAVLAAMRGRIIETLVRETEMTFAEADTEVVRAVTVVRRLARMTDALTDVANAEFVPAAAVLIAPGWVAAASDTAEGIATALAAGSGAIVQPAHQARHCAAIIVEAAHEAGLPHALVTLAVPEDATVARRAVAHPDIDHVLFAGDRDTAQLLRSWRPDRPPIGDVRGVTSVIVCESADVDNAVRDIVAGGFARAGQHPEGARLVILVGDRGEGEHLRRRLADAVRSLHPASPLEASARMGPLIGPPTERARRLLTITDADETWLVQPDALDDRLTLWRPGVRDSVAPEVALQRVVDGPGLVLTTVPDLAAAVRLQNSGRGEAAGIHTLDVDELAFWLDGVDAGSLHVNTPTVGGPLDTLPGGGWLGAGALRGSAERLIVLGDWAPTFAEPQQSVRLEGIDDRVRILIEAAQPAMRFLEFDLVRAGAVSDETAWREHYRDATAELELESRRTIVRHLPVATTIRLADGASSAQLVRVLAAATLVGARVAISAATPLPERLVQLFAHPLSPLRVDGVLVESDARWYARVQNGDVETPHIRLLGGDAEVLATVLATRPDVALFAAPVTTSGRLELLPFLRAQVVSMATQRHGRPDPMVAQIEF